MRSSYPKGTWEAAEAKAQKLRGPDPNNKVLEPHHITPIHFSAKLQASMTPEQWAERVKRDAEAGTYHGHHPKNIMGTVIATTPERHRRRGILHTSLRGSGGAHDLERQTKDLYSHPITHRDLLVHTHRQRLKKEKEKS